MKIVFMGTPDFALESLKALYETNNEIALVVTNPDRKKGRGMKMSFSPVKEFAVEKKLNISQPTKIRDNEEFAEELRKIKPDLFCVVAYGKILPKEILNIPKYGSINVHGSLLPEYRGACPIQWSVINGDKETGITTMFMDEGMDTGDIILQEKVSIGDDETLGELWNRLAILGGKKLVETVSKIEQESNKISNENDVKTEIKKLVNAKKQGEKFTIAPMLTKEIAKIDWNESSLKIKNLIRGLNPEMGAYAIYNGKKIKIWKSQIVNEDELNDLRQDNIDISKFNPGEIALADRKKGLFVKTGDGVISLLELQPENSKRMDYASFLNGYKIEGKFDN